MKTFKEKSCRVCGKIFLPIGPAGLYCSDCAPIMAKKAEIRGYEAYERRNGVLVGVGTGHHQIFGKDNVCYKFGLGTYVKDKLKLMSEYKCERCGKDLTLDITNKSKTWGVHHKDRNRKNNNPDNWELLCKSCHQIEHEVIFNIPGMKQILEDKSNGI